MANEDDDDDKKKETSRKRRKVDSDNDRGRCIRGTVFF